MSPVLPDIIAYSKNDRLLNCFWYIRIVNEFEYLSGHHTFGFPEYGTLSTSMSLMVPLETIVASEILDPWGF